MTLVDPLAVTVNLSMESGEATELTRARAVIPRFGPELQRTGLAVLRMLESRGLHSLNRAGAFELARDKVASLQVLAAQGLPLPATVVVSDPSQVRGAIAAVGGTPVVVKAADGWRGEGTVLAETSASALSILDGLADAARPLLVQRFVAEADRQDLRILVVAGQVRAAMKRKAAAGDFRANISRGGSAELCSLTPAQDSLARRAAEILGLGLAGVDLLSTPAGDLLLEVNAAPGFAALEEATGIDVAGLILEATVAGAEPPE